MRGDEEDPAYQSLCTAAGVVLEQNASFQKHLFKSKKKENLQTYCTSKDFIKAINEERK